MKPLMRNEKHTDAVRQILHGAGITGMLVAETGLAALDAAKGAYVLVIDLFDDVSVRLPKREPTRLEAGTYLYVGSANGPGGMAARLKRHMSNAKKIHWHVDQLTTRASSVVAFAVKGGNECALGQTLIESKQFRPALKGFGSSDCKACDSHLLVSI